MRKWRRSGESYQSNTGGGEGLGTRLERGGREGERESDCMALVFMMPLGTFS